MNQHYCKVLQKQCVADLAVILQQAVLPSKCTGSTLSYSPAADNHVLQQQQVASTWPELGMDVLPAG